MPKHAPGIFLFTAIVYSFSLSACQYTRSDLDDAHRLLRITEAGEQFELAMQMQTADIVRTYASIIAMSTETTLPDSIKQEIANCYYQSYAWDRFEPEIARIFADNLNKSELKLLIDFFSDRSVPPTRIGQFKNLGDKATTIEQLSIDYIYSNSEDCDKKNVALVLSYLATYLTNLSS